MYPHLRHIRDGLEGLAEHDVVFDGLKYWSIWSSSKGLRGTKLDVIGYVKPCPGGATASTLERGKHTMTPQEARVATKNAIGPLWHNGALVYLLPSGA